mmetsp:Transcript_18107/g.27013  ORF Transcript_18107/g.27013 Transcript_18107/m.27013 type:complete len:106 (-) Transcript_18107:736-1053(-)
MHLRVDRCSVYHIQPTKCCITTPSKANFLQSLLSQRVTFYIQLFLSNSRTYAGDWFRNHDEQHQKEVTEKRSKYTHIFHQGDSSKESLAIDNHLKGQQTLMEREL